MANNEPAHNSGATDTADLATQGRLKRLLVSRRAKKMKGQGGGRSKNAPDPEGKKDQDKATDAKEKKAGFFSKTDTDADDDAKEIKFPKKK